MAGNAHKRRNRKRPSPKHKDICQFCFTRPKFGNYRNSNGHRHNPASNKKQKK